MKVILNYDPTTGQISDANGQSLFSWLNLNHEPVLETVRATEVNDLLKLKEAGFTTEVNDLVKLKEAGFTTEEMVNLRDRGLI